MKSVFAIFASFAFTLSFALQGTADENHKPYVGSKAFQTMKRLSGSWEGTIDMGQGPQKINTSYRVTSAGSALIETDFEGSPHEMVTIYHDDSHQRLSMIHYCGLNNRPTLTLVREADNQLEFDLKEEGAADLMAENHMHSLIVSFHGKDAITQEWTEFREGKKFKTVEIKFKRVSQ